MLVRIPQKALWVLGVPSRYKGLYGGRGSAKSWSVARVLIARAAVEKLRILCTRELQTSIRDSVHKLLCDQIEAMGLQSSFIITRDSIVSLTGSEFIFKGLKHSITGVRSTEGIDICWVEEAEAVSAESWQILMPTIRNPGSEIWATFNPEEEDSYTYQFWVKNPPPNSRILKMNWSDNPWFPKELDDLRTYTFNVDPDAYAHIWDGLPKKYSQACILNHKVVVEAFEIPTNADFLYGADWGFSQDPTAVGRMFIKDYDLYICNEVYKVGVEIDDLPQFFMGLPDVRRWEITADSARPETISHMNRKGFVVNAAEKGAGSVEDGIEFLRSFKRIVIHPSCTGAIQDFKNYKYKIDKQTGKILREPAKGFDHWPDLARYALEKFIKQKKSIFEVL